MSAITASNNTSRITTPPVQLLLMEG